MTTVQTYFVEEVKQLVTEEKDLSQWLDLWKRWDYLDRQPCLLTGEKSHSIYHMKSTMIQSFNIGGVYDKILRGLYAEEECYVYDSFKLAKDRNHRRREKLRAR